MTTRGNSKPKRNGSFQKHQIAETGTCQGCQRPASDRTSCAHIQNVCRGCAIRHHHEAGLPVQACVKATLAEIADVMRPGLRARIEQSSASGPVRELMTGGVVTGLGKERGL